VASFQSSAASARLSVVLRLLAASLGAYAVTYWATAAASLSLPLSRSDAAIVATNLSFLLMTGLAFWSFCFRSVARLWALLLGLVLIFWTLAQVLHP